MPSYKVAHIHEQGVDLIIIPLESSFRHKTTQDQNATAVQLEARAHAAGLAGTVVLVWDAGSGRMGFLAPPNFSSFFKSVDLGFVGANINRELSW